MRLFLFLCFITINVASIFAQVNTINDFIKAEQYEDAIQLIMKYGEIEDIDSKELESLGFCYVELNNYTKAELVFKELISRKKPNPSNYLLYAETLIVKEDYQLAKVNYNKYISFNPHDTLAYIMLESCDSLQKWTKIEKNNEISTVPTLNSNEDDMCYCAIKDKFVLVSDRLETKDENIADEIVMKPYYYSNNDVNAIFPELAKEYWCSSINYCEDKDVFAFSVSPYNWTMYGNLVYYTVIMFSPATNETIEGLVKFEWDSMPSEINIMHPYFHNKGHRLYFCSDMPGGYGGTDIYYSDLKNNIWTTPVNLGEKINTPFNEISPATLGDSIIYFSSNGHAGYGNFDCYSSKIINGDKFEKPQNLLAPINSYGSDVFYYPQSASIATVTSNRSTMGKNDYDIFQIGSEEKTEQIDSILITPTDTIIPEFNFISYESPNILFDNDRYEIKNNFYQSLDDLADTLIKYDYLNLEIIGYTDTNGSDSLNNTLSKNRSKSVAEYLINQGVNSTQIATQGLGKSHLITCEDLHFHVIIGAINTDTQLAWYQNLVNNQYEITIMQIGNQYKYLTGNFTDIKDAVKLNTELLNNYGLQCYVEASYYNQILSDFKLAINRRVELKISK